MNLNRVFDARECRSRPGCDNNILLGNSIPSPVWIGNLDLVWTDEFSGPKTNLKAQSFESSTQIFREPGAYPPLMMQMLGSFAEFERAMLKERTSLGLARAAGRIGGARFKLSPAQQKEAISMVKVGGKTQVEVAELFNVDRSTISRLVSERGVSR
jgi:CRP-like cAMP-binding protein